MKLLSLILGPDSTKDLLSFFVDDESAEEVLGAWRNQQPAEFNYYSANGATPTDKLSFAIVDTENVIGIICSEVNTDNEG